MSAAAGVPEDDALLVELGGRAAGTLRRESDGSLSFAYAESWLEGGFALTRGLPLEPGWRSTDYFENLLPEAMTRERIARRLGISAGNTFAFLARFGRDCAGALDIRASGEPADAPPSASAADSSASVLWLSDDDGALLETPAGFAELLAHERVRLSLAGAQSKLAVVIEAPIEGDGKSVDSIRIGVPLDGQASTHVLKPPNRDYKGLVHNEAAMLTLAARCGLPVPAHRIVTLGGVPLLLIEHYDRRREGAHIRRLHQQDLGQAAGLAPARKYESEGGPSLAQVFALVRAISSEPLVDARLLLRWVVFNVLVHNADAHAKNISLVRRDEVWVLAPFYDLTCTGAYPNLDHRLAMSIGGQADAGVLGPKAWRRFAEDVGVGFRFVSNTIAELADAIPDTLDEVLDELAAAHGEVPRRQQLRETVRKRSQRGGALLRARG